MNTLVVLQCVRSVESFATVITAVTTFSAMNKPMLVEYGSGQKSLATNLAVIWPLAGVTLSNMVVEIGTNGETSRAVRFLTGERFDSFVEAQMLPQVTGLSVRLSAYIAQILPVFG